MASSIKQAVILAAGFGSRLARNEKDMKPLRQVGGGSLIRRNLLLLASAGVEECIIVVGYKGDELQAAVEQEASGLPIALRFVHNEAYRKSNGLSVLCAEPFVGGDFLLMMADHIFDRAMIEQAVLLEAPVQGALLCVDYKLGCVFDMDDATKVMTDGERVLQISKGLERFNAIDTGLFVCSRALFAALEEARSQRGDCSLSEGVAALVACERMFVHDIGEAMWQDVDDEGMLEHAEALLRAHMIDSDLGTTARNHFGVAA